MVISYDHTKDENKRMDEKKNTINLDVIILGAVVYIALIICVPFCFITTDWTGIIGVIGALIVNTLCIWTFWDYDFGK